MEPETKKKSSGTARIVLTILIVLLMCFHLMLILMHVEFVASFEDAYAREVSFWYKTTPPALAFTWICYGLWAIYFKAGLFHKVVAMLIGVTSAFVLGPAIIII